MDRKQAVLAIALLCVVIFGAGYKAARYRETGKPLPVMAANAVYKEQAERRTVTVHVTGTVNRPGVYTLNEGARVIDAVNKAGAGKEADTAAINLAELLTDQQQVYVPRKGEIDTQGGSARGGTGPVSPSAGRGSRPGKININTADSATLDGLPGIGPSTAKKIVDYRKEHGRFKNISGLLEVPGIGEKKLDEIRDSITI